MTTPQFSKWVRKSEEALLLLCSAARYSFQQPREAWTCASGRDWLARAPQLPWAAELSIEREAEAVLCAEMRDELGVVA